MIRFWSVLVGGWVGMIALAAGAPVVSAHGTPQIVGEPIPHERALGTTVYRDCGLRKEAVDAFVHHPPAPLQGKRANTTIEVSYGGNFPDAAQAAFDRAADIWERHIFSSVTIRIQAAYEALGDRVVGIYDREVGEAQRKQYTAGNQTPGRYAYRVTARDEAGNAVSSAVREVQVDCEGDVYALGPYPNPVREAASLDLTARGSQTVIVEVYNTLGERVYTAQRELRAQDPTSISIDVRGWASGVYFLRLWGQTSIGQTDKMVVIR